MLRITDILDKTQDYLSPDDLEMIEKAYIFSASVHQGQVRLSGEPYLTHPVEVAGIHEARRRHDHFGLPP
jgi:GTP diphosphokinase / guanosine-3',5'-bis(diphosphate) 3'-diphosphatase